MIRNGLYLLTRETTDSDLLLDTVLAGILGGAVLVQYRDKSSDQQRRFAQAKALQRLCAQHAVPFIINDDIQLAIDCQADGVHLGRNDATVGEARKLMGQTAIIGVSCYNDLSLAESAAKAGASYLAFGRFFASTTKPDASTASVEILQQAQKFKLPIVAIGGISADNAAPLIAAGADCLALLASVWDAPHPQIAATQISQIFTNT